jgi:hypothetical protein
MAVPGPQAWQEVKFALRNRAGNSPVESANLVLFIMFKWLETCRQEKARPRQRGTTTNIFHRWIPPTM